MSSSGFGIRRRKAQGSAGLMHRGLVPVGFRWGAPSAALTVAVALAGCGGGDDKPKAKALTLPEPSKPSAAKCGKELKEAAKSPKKPPTAGTYEYETTGKRVFIGERRQTTKLPSRSEVIITPALKTKKVWCFTSQRRLESDLGDTATFLIRGEDVYLRTLRFQVGGYIKNLSPNPPVLTLSGTDLDWSGVFRGSTSGRYAAEIVGRKHIKVGSRKVKAVGVKTRLSYGGDIKGWERSTRWLDLKRNLVISETVQQERKFGLDRLRLSYKADLKHLRPRS